MSTQILYGVGNAILRDFTNKKNVIALTKLKNVGVEASASDEKIHGGDSPYPIATFPKEKSIKIHAENATFDIKLLEATQGAKLVKGGARNMVEVMTILVPADGKVTLPHTPNKDTVAVTGYTISDKSASPSPSATTVVLDGVNLTFAVSEAGKETDIIYERTTVDAKTSVIEIFKDTMAKPFEFIHRIPVYDDNNTIVAQAQLTVYKAKSNNAFNFGFQPNQAFAPKVEFEALDPKRPDKKLWDFVLEEV